MCDTPNLEWYREMVCNVESLEYHKQTLLENLNLDYVEMINKDVEDLRKCIVSRLSRFVSNHIPSNKGSLYPGVHWVWDSFQYLLPKLCAVVIMSGHSVTCINLPQRTHTENY